MPADRADSGRRPRAGPDSRWLISWQNVIDGGQVILDASENLLLRARQGAAVVRAGLDDVGIAGTFRAAGQLVPTRLPGAPYLQPRPHSIHRPPWSAAHQPAVFAGLVDVEHAVGVSVKLILRAIPR
jgi:hypothetical protein